jgi:hypothetical protein
MEIAIGILMVLNGILFIAWGRKPDAPKWYLRFGVGLVLFGTLAAVGKLVFQSAF